MRCGILDWKLNKSQKSETTGHSVSVPKSGEIAQNETGHSFILVSLFHSRWRRYRRAADEHWIRTLIGLGLFNFHLRTLNTQSYRNICLQNQ